MHYVFLSHVLNNNTPSYGNKDHFRSEPQNEISKGFSANTSIWHFSNNHIGTHIDLPYHFDDGGKKYEDYSADDFIFKKTELVDISFCEGLLIDIESFQWESICKNADLILIRTGYEKYRKSDKYWIDNPGLAPDLCKYLKQKFKFLRAIGFDFISLTSANYKPEGRLSHNILLSDLYRKEPVIIIEDMALSNVKSKIKQVIIAPLMVENGNGGPVTIFANMYNKND